jgi:hypothetical protein
MPAAATSIAASETRRTINSQRMRSKPRSEYQTSAAGGRADDLGRVPSDINYRRVKKAVRRADGNRGWEASEICGKRLQKNGRKRVFLPSKPPVWG